MSRVTASPWRRIAFMDSGAMQHVFQDPDDSAFVWKIPAVRDDLLPQPQTLANFQPTDSRKAAWWAQVQPTLHAPGLRGPAERCLRRYLLHRRMRSFAVMLQAVQRVKSLIMEEVLLPCEVVRHRRFILETPVGVHRYVGPALKQRRADHFMAHECHLEFDWQVPVRIQHTLWGIGIGLGDADTVLGPHNWAILNGRLLLGDTGSLATNRQTAEAAMAEEVQSRVAERLIARLTPSGHEAVARAYANDVRAGINLETLARLWHEG